MKTRILQLVDSFAQGGSERQAIQLTRLLQEKGYPAQIACLNPGGKLRPEAERLFGTIPSFFFKGFYSASAARQCGRLAAFLKRERIGILQTHDFYTNVFGMAAGALAGVPVRIAARRETNGVRKRGQVWVEHRAYSLAHAIVANSMAVRDQLRRERVNDGKICIVYNGINPDRFTMPADFDAAWTRARFGLPATGPVVSIVANMDSAVKDHAGFLRAAARVAADAPETVFALAGAGRLQDSLLAQARESGLAASAVFVGATPDVPALLGVSTLGVLSSRAEGFSNSILEYMAASLPVVATDVGGAREAVVDGETGFTVPPADPDALSAAILRVLHDPALGRRMGAAGRARVEKQFSCATQLHETIQLYEGLSGERAQRQHG